MEEVKFWFRGIIFKNSIFGFSGIIFHAQIAQRVQIAQNPQPSPVCTKCANCTHRAMHLQLSEYFEKIE